MDTFLNLVRTFDGVLWLVGIFVLFLLVQRWLHAEIQTSLMLITRKENSALTLYALLFLPGVFLAVCQGLCKI